MLGHNKRLKELKSRQILLVATVAISVILGLTKLVGFFKEAIRAGEKQTVASIKVGINRYFIESASLGRTPLYPETLDGALNSQASGKNPFFINVLAFPGITSGKWRKLLPTVYQGPSLDLYFYEPLSGDFSEKKILPDKIARLLGINQNQISGDLISQLYSRCSIPFADGKRLVGGAVVWVSRSKNNFVLKGEDSQEKTFSFLQGDLLAEITTDLAVPVSQTKFGYYTFEPNTRNKTLYEIFDGQEVPGIIKSFSIEPGSLVGFYCMTTDGKNNIIYYSQKENNLDKFDHLRIYQNKVFRKITVACETSWGGEEKDYQDMMVTISY
jgi:hypothetical protein